MRLNKAVAMALQTFDEQGVRTGIILTTAFVTFVTGYAFGIFTIRGYLISPALSEERRRNLHDPIESEESDVDEDDSLLDHAPNWVNGDAADRRQGLRARGPNAPAAAPSTPQPAININANEECKLVLVVRTDLGMTKGAFPFPCSAWLMSFLLTDFDIQVKSPRSAPTPPSLATRRSHAILIQHLPNAACSTAGRNGARLRSPSRSRARKRCSSCAARPRPWA